MGRAVIAIPMRLEALRLNLVAGKIALRLLAFAQLLRLLLGGNLLRQGLAPEDVMQKPHRGHHQHDADDVEEKATAGVDQEEQEAAAEQRRQHQRQEMATLLLLGRRVLWLHGCSPGGAPWKRR